MENFIFCAVESEFKKSNHWYTTVSRDTPLCHALEVLGNAFNLIPHLLSFDK